MFYAGHVDADTVSVLAINKTDTSLATSIQINGFGGILGGTADVVRSNGLNDEIVTYNGDSNPANDLSDAPPTAIGPSANPMDYTFPPYSITVLLLDVAGPASNVNGVSPMGVTLDKFDFLPIIIKPGSGANC